MEIKNAIRMLAEQIAESRFPMKHGTKEEFDSIVEQAKKHYHRYSASTKKVDVDGVDVDVELHVVGHNASHEFSIGILADGRFVKCSCGDDWDIEGELVLNTRFHVGNTVGYLGHW